MAIKATSAYAVTIPLPSKGTVSDAVSDSSSSLLVKTFTFSDGSSSSSGGVFLYTPDSCSSPWRSYDYYIATLSDGMEVFGFQESPLIDCDSNWGDPLTTMTPDGFTEVYDVGAESLLVTYSTYADGLAKLATIPRPSLDLDFSVPQMILGPRSTQIRALTEHEPTRLDPQTLTQTNETPLREVRVLTSCEDPLIERRIQTFLVYYLRGRCWGRDRTIPVSVPPQYIVNQDGVIRLGFPVMDAPGVVACQKAKELANKACYTTSAIEQIVLAGVGLAGAAITMGATLPIVLGVALMPTAYWGAKCGYEQLEEEITFCSEDQNPRFDCVVVDRAKLVLRWVGRGTREIPITTDGWSMANPITLEDPFGEWAVRGVDFAFAVTKPDANGDRALFSMEGIISERKVPYSEGIESVAEAQLLYGHRYKAVFKYPKQAWFRIAVLPDPFVAVYSLFNSDTRSLNYSDIKVLMDTEVSFEPSAVRVSAPGIAQLEGGEFVPVRVKLRLDWGEAPDVAVNLKVYCRFDDPRCPSPGSWEVSGMVDIGLVNELVSFADACATSP